MTERTEDIAVALFGELFMADQLARNLVSKALPRGMELSHFSVLNHLTGLAEERTPAQLARAFHVTRGAMTNTWPSWRLRGIFISVPIGMMPARNSWRSVRPAGRRGMRRFRPWHP